VFTHDRFGFDHLSINFEKLVVQRNIKGVGNSACFEASQEGDAPQHEGQRLFLTLRCEPLRASKGRLSKAKTYFFFFFETLASASDGNSPSRRTGACTANVDTSCPFKSAACLP
jgi:hypothetical protein